MSRGPLRKPLWTPSVRRHLAGPWNRTRRRGRRLVAFPPRVWCRRAGERANRPSGDGVPTPVFRPCTSWLQQGRRTSTPPR